MKRAVLLGLVAAAGCAEQSEQVRPDYLSQIETRVIYTAVEPLNGELEIHNYGGRAVTFATPFFAFSDSREARTLALVAASYAGEGFIYERATLKPHDVTRVPIPTNNPAKFVGVYFFVDSRGADYDSTVVWSNNMQR
jgi:hypothetical protein